MRLSNVLRQGEQSGQMLVSVIVLLTLMFFVGSAMALAVSTSLHTIAQTNYTDSTAYAAESAVALGLARRATPFFGAPKIGSVVNSGTTVPPVGCNNGIPGEQSGNDQSGNDGHLGGHRGQQDNNGNQGNTNLTSGMSTSAASGPPVLSAVPTWRYAYEVVADGNLVGRSSVGSGQGPAQLDGKNYETIHIDPVANTWGATNIVFEVYRTTSGGDPSTLGCIGVVAQQPGGTDINDPGPVEPSPPMCTSTSAPPLTRQVNNYFPGGKQGPLTASICRVPVENGSVKEWTAPAQTVAGCTTQTLSPSFTLDHRTGTAWGVIGWHPVSSTNPNPKFRVSVAAACSKDDKCFTRVTSPGALYYWCNVGDANQTTTIGNLYLVNDGDAAKVNAFVMRAALSGRDCIATTIGHAGLVVDEAAELMPGCDWTSTSTQTFWNQVLP